MRRSVAQPRTLGFGEFFGRTEFGRNLSGFSLARIAARQPPFEVPGHTHESGHVVLVLDGVYITSAVRVEPGRDPTLIYNPPGTAHRDRFRDDGVFFTLSLSDRRLNALGAGRLPAHPVGFSSGRCVRLARRLTRICRSWPPRSTARAEALCVDLLAGLLDDATTRRPLPPPWLAGARATLAARYDEAPRLGDLAAAAAVHPVHLIRSFKRFYGVTPAAFLRERRLEVAASLLRGTDLPIVEIALRTGFADQSHFTRSFTRRFAISPAADRRRKPG
jgi:AraC family transcriptional regulator